MLVAHLKTLHHDSFTESQLSVVVNSCGRTIPELSAEQCPLCDEWATSMQSLALGLSGIDAEKLMAVSRKVFRSHVGRHLEQLALFAVPRSQGDDGIDDRTSDGTDSVRLSPGDVSSEVSENAVPETEKRAKAAAEKYEKTLEEATAATETAKKGEDSPEAEAEAEAGLEKYKPGGNAKKGSFTFKDAWGRKFRFPWELCKTWKVLLSFISKRIDSGSAH